MKFEIMRDSLLDGLNDVMKAVSSKTTIPILTGLKLEVTNKGLYITGSDSDITIQTFIPVEKNGEQIINIIRNRFNCFTSQVSSMKLYVNYLQMK